MIHVNRQVQIPLKELEFDFVKGSGAGGQKINKTNSCVLLTWNLNKSVALSEAAKDRVYKKIKSRVSASGDIVIRSQRFRDRGKNVADCMEKLRVLLLEALKVEKIRKKTKVPKSAVKKRRDDKKKRSDVKKTRGKVRIS